MKTLRSLCVYCGSKLGNDPRHEAVAVELGRLMAQSGVRLVYGGGSVGLMGSVADSVLANGGEVFGVIPKGLFTTEIGHPGLTELVEVGSMHERKALMAKFIHKEVAGADKRAGSRAGQTAAWAGIQCLLVVLAMLIVASPLHGPLFVARGTKSKQILKNWVLYASIRSSVIKCYIFLCLAFLSLK